MTSGHYKTLAIILLSISLTVTNITLILKIRLINAYEENVRASDELIGLMQEKIRLLEDK